LGKNPDGSDRVEYHDDPSWEPPTDGNMANNSSWLTISPPTYSPDASWADVAFMEDEYDRRVETEQRRLTRPKIPVILDPLMELPPYTLTPEQVEAKRNKIIDDNEGKKDFEPSMIEIPKLAYLSIDRAMVTKVDSKFMPNILKCRSVPSWITKDIIKVQFSPYAKDVTTLHGRYIKGRHTEETYPFVNINDERVAFVIFDPSTNDAQFALHMMKKTVIKKKLADGTFNVATLIFNHSFRTDRDLMADISQQPRPVKRSDNQQRANYRSRNDLSSRHGSRSVSSGAKEINKRGNTFNVLVDETN